MENQELLSDPPSSPAYFKLYADKFDHEFARNALLHFIEENGLSEKCANWLEEKFPREDLKKMIDLKYQDYLNRKII